MIDRELLQETLARVEQENAKGEESLWIQTTWSRSTECGTAFCFAGWIVKCFAEKHPGQIDMSVVAASDRVMLKGRMQHLQVAAALVAGLTEIQAAYLFEPSNKLEDLKTGLRGIFAQEDALAEKKGERL